MAKTKAPSMIEKLIRAHFRLEAEIGKLNRQHKEMTDPLKAQLEKVDTGVLKYLDKLGVDNVKIDGLGLARATEKEFFPIKDRGKFYDYLTETADYDLISMRIALREMRTRYAQDGKLPPGISVSTEREVSITTAK